jgi:hypothetical protein
MSRTFQVRESFSWPAQLALEKPGFITGFEIGAGPSRRFKTVSHPLSVPLPCRR